jgi:hypothetical protein
MDTTTAFNHSISKLAAQFPANYQLQADDPIHNLTGMLDRIEQIKEAIPQAVTQSLTLATTKLSTQFELVSVPLLTSIQEERGTLSAIHDQMTSLEKRFINTGHVTAPTQDWNIWLSLGCSFTMLGLLGYNTFTVKNLAWSQTPTGHLAKQMVDRNPQLVDSCRTLTAKDQKYLGKGHSAKKICSVFL